MSAPIKKWEDLSYRTQVRLFHLKDPRVPGDFAPKPVGRPKGTPMTLQHKRRLSATKFDDPMRRAKRVAKAVSILLLEYGSVDGIVKELRRG